MVRLFIIACIIWVVNPHACLSGREVSCRLEWFPARLTFVTATMISRENFVSNCNFAQISSWHYRKLKNFNALTISELDLLCFYFEKWSTRFSCLVCAQFTCTSYIRRSDLWWHLIISNLSIYPMKQQPKVVLLGYFYTRINSFVELSSFNTKAKIVSNNWSYS